MMKNRIKKSFTVMLAAIMTALSMWSLCGCTFLFNMFSDNDGVMFTRGSITLQMGTSLDLDEIIECATTYTLSSSDSSVVSVNGSVATAESVGTAYIFAETAWSNDRLRVTVTDVNPDSLGLQASGELIQTMGETSTVVFTPVATGSVVAQAVSWYVDGNFVATKSTNESFEFTPTSAAVYTISATSGEFEAEAIVRCYYAVDASVTASGEFEQHTMPYSAINFAVEIDTDPQNPDDYIEWYADGTLIYAGSGTSYMYRPSVGRHTITAVVNGKTVYTAEGWFRGAETPNKPSVVFDNEYPHIYVEYKAMGDAAVEITAPNGSSSVYEQTDPRYRHLFSSRGFDAGEFITLCSTSNLRRTYTIKVKSLGDGDAYIESAFSEGYSFMQLPAGAKKYVETFCLDTDLYVTSDLEYAKLMEYYIINRKKSANSSVSFDCYIAYALSGDEDELWTDAFHVAATSGLYKSISVSLKNNVLRTSFVVDTVNTPTRQATESRLYKRADQLHAILPHINYDENKYRAKDCVFPIETAERSANVTYSDELYLAVERGVKPLPTAGSSAATIYDLARDVLRKICTDDMTDVQKAHAIYDWIMWHVTYDSPATSGSNGEEYSAYYLEGVFADGETAIGGKVYQPYAVCDGISKAYSLLCNMEGIPCVRVTGNAGKTVSNSGGHAWNKVFVNGGWYAVDSTWGDAVASIDLGGLSNNDYELGLHDHLFLTQSQISGDHYEPYEIGDSTIAYVPLATEKPLDIYSQMEFNGVVVNSVVSGGQNTVERVREIVSAHARAYKTIGTVTVPGSGPERISYNGFEIKFENGVSISNGELKTLITNAVRSVHPSLQVRSYITGNIVIVLMYQR